MPMLRVSMPRPPGSDHSRPMRSRSPSTQRACRIIEAPCTVGKVPFEVRSNSLAPTISSSSASIRETAGWVVAMRRAASPTLRTSSITTSRRRWRSRSRPRRNQSARSAASGASDITYQF